MRPTANHIQMALLRAITAKAATISTDREKPIMIVELITSEDWASATFVGATHCFEVRLEGGLADVEIAATRVSDGMRDDEIVVPGQIVADIEVVTSETLLMTDNMVSKNLTVNVLTIED